MAKPSICSLHRCGREAATPLRAKPPFDPAHPDGVFWFCAYHAPIYEALGYKPLGSAAA